VSAQPRKPTSESPAHAPGFEESLAQLESIIERIESGEIGLEQSIAEYERGMTLIGRCREILEKAEQRVEELNRKQAGSREQA
jgi:exodeoxyribonuclease VII small subunit